MYLNLPHENSIKIQVHLYKIRSVRYIIIPFIVINILNKNNKDFTMSSSFEIYLNELFRRSNPNHDLQLANSPLLSSPLYNRTLDLPYLTPTSPPSPYTHLQTVGVPNFTPQPLPLPPSYPNTPPTSYPQLKTERSRPPRIEIPEISPQSTSADTTTVPTPLLTPVPVMSSTLNHPFIKVQIHFP